jgi:hypothetical protein
MRLNHCSGVSRGADRSNQPVAGHDARLPQPSETAILAANRQSTIDGMSGVILLAIAQFRAPA